MALNETQKAEFLNQTTFVQQLGLVDGMRGITAETQLFAVNLNNIIGVEERTVDTYVDLPDPTLVTVDEMWVVLEETLPSFQSGGYYSNGAAWIYFDNMGIYDNYVDAEFKDSFVGETPITVLEEWFKNFGFEIVSTHKWLYHSGIAFYETLGDARGYYVPNNADAHSEIEWVAGGVIREIQEYFMDVEGITAPTDATEYVAAVEQLLAIVHSIDPEEGDVFRYYDIDQAYMYVDKGAALENAIDALIEANGDGYLPTVGDLRYNYLVNGDPSDPASDLYKLMILPQFEKTLKNTEQDLQETIIEDDSNRQTMQDSFDIIGDFAAKTATMYDDAIIREYHQWTGAEIHDASPQNPLPPVPGTQAVYSYEPVGAPPPTPPLFSTQQILVKTYWPIIGTDSATRISNITLLEIDDVDVTSFITSSPSAYEVMVMNWDTIPPAPAVPTKVEIEYKVDFSLLYWTYPGDHPAVSGIPKVYVRDNTDSVRIGYRMLKLVDIYFPDPSIRETFDPSYLTPDPYEPPYMEHIDYWRVVSNGWNPEFEATLLPEMDVDLPDPDVPTTGKLYFYTLDAENATWSGSNWTCSPPPGYTDVPEFLQSIAKAWTDDKRDVIFNAARDIRENPQEYEDSEVTPPPADPTIRYAPDGTRAEIINICELYDGLFSKRAEVLAKKEYYDSIVAAYDLEP